MSPLNRQVGEPRQAPDFELPNQFGEPVALRALRGSPVVLVFFPFAFSQVCTGELRELRDAASVFDAAGARVLAVSCDSRFTLRAWARSEDLGFDLLSDFWPHGEVSRAYGAFDEAQGRPGRLTVVIGPDGTVSSSFRAAAGEPRPLESYRRALSGYAARPEPAAPERTDAHDR